MKKLLYLCAAVVLFSVMGCTQKGEAEKEVVLCIKKMEYFNNMFEEFNKDGVIEKTESETCEYEMLKKVASEYYELMNKINTLKKEDEALVEQGKNSNGFNEAYQKALEKHKSEINNQSSRFIKNLQLIEGTELMQRGISLE